MPVPRPRRPFTTEEFACGSIEAAPSPNVSGFRRRCLVQEGTEIGLSESVIVTLFRLAHGWERGESHMNFNPPRIGAEGKQLDEY